MTRRWIAENLMIGYESGVSRAVSFVASSAAPEVLTMKSKLNTHISASQHNSRTLHSDELKAKPLASYGGKFILTDMITTLSTKGQAVIPESIREQARLKAGDKLDIGYINGLVVLRKRVPLTPAQARALILSGRDLPIQTAKDETQVQKALAAVRGRRHSA